MVAENKKQYRKQNINTRGKKTSTSTAMPTVADDVSEVNLAVAVFVSLAQGIILLMDKVKYNKLYEQLLFGRTVGQTLVRLLPSVPKNAVKMKY